MNGLEMMFRSLGMGEVLEAAQKMATDGTVQKIIAFAEGLPELNERLSRIEQHLGIVAGGAVIDSECRELRSSVDEPGPRPADSGPVVAA